MEGRKVITLPRREVFQIASRLMGIIALDEEIILQKMAMEGIQVSKEGDWYRLSWMEKTLVRRVGGRIDGNNPLDVLLRCYLLLKEEEEKEEGGREAA